MYKVYIQTNQYGIVTAINSSAFLPDTTGWTQIDEGEGDATETLAAIQGITFTIIDGELEVTI